VSALRALLVDLETSCTGAQDFNHFQHPKWESHGDWIENFE
jgi:hypothetical protein